MPTFVLPALLSVLCALAQSAPSTALATPTERPCSLGEFFNADHSMCDPCAVLPKNPSDQEQLHYQQQCLSHPVCCPASVPGETPPHANVTSPSSTGKEPRGGLATLSPSSAAEPDAGCSSLPRGATVAIAALALLVIALVGAVIFLLMRLRKIQNQKQKAFTGEENRRGAAVGEGGGERLLNQIDVHAAAAPPVRDHGPTVTNQPARGDDKSTYYASTGQG